MTLAPTLLYNDECGVCRAIARWVKKSAINPAGETQIIERPIGEDPQALLQLSPGLNIWDAYATIHLVMPDGTMKLGGEAVAEVLRNIPKTRWFAWTFNVSIFGFRPAQKILDLAYAVLADIRPLIETYPLERAAEAFDRMMSGKARFRVVLTMP